MFHVIETRNPNVTWKGKEEKRGMSWKTHEPSVHASVTQRIGKQAPEADGPPLPFPRPRAQAGVRWAVGPSAGVGGNRVHRSAAPGTEKPGEASWGYGEAKGCAALCVRELLDHGDGLSF